MRLSKTTSILTALVSLIPLIGLTSCATRGPKKVYAFPQATPIASPLNWAVESAPRTQPGKIMDPEAVTYAQVPSRILYLPGQEGIFGRSSASQDVAYNLVPVDRIGEIVKGSAPRFDQKPSALGARSNSKEEEPETKLEVKETFSTVIPQEDGTVLRGEARRLGITDESEKEKRRAASMLRGPETLMWKPGVGWVGFVADKVTRIPDPSPKGNQKPPPSITPVDEPSNKGTAPTLVEPKGSTEVVSPLPSTPKPNPSTAKPKEGTTMDLP